MTTSDHRRPDVRHRFARDSLVLAFGTILTGLLAYVFFALATRFLGAAGAAPVTVLWSYWAIAAAVLTFSVQHWIIATLAADGHETNVARALPRIAATGVLLSALAGIVAFAARGPLFADRGAAFPALVALVTGGSLLTGVVRGALAGRRRYVATAVSLVVENAVRVAGAVAATLADAGSVAFGLSLAVGSLSGLLFVRALRFERAQPQPGSSPARNALALMSGIAGGSLVAQVLLTGGPVVLAAVGGSPAEVTSVFVALALWRAPYLVALGVAPQLTGWLAGIARRGERRRLERLRIATVIATTAAAVAAAVLAVTVMPWLLQAVFGQDVALATGLLVALGVGTAIALGNLVLLLLLLALERPRSATGAWTAALLVAAGWLAVGVGEPVTRVVVAFVLAQLTALVLLLWRSGTPPARRESYTGADG